MQTIPRVIDLQNSLCPLRMRLADHDVYSGIETLQDLQLFMEHHVFAVWDFMSLLKALQRRLTCVIVPWVPEGVRLTRRLINEIVLEEESDSDGGGGYISHFELYLNAMKQCGADTSRVDAFLHAVRRGLAIESSLTGACAPRAAREFVKTTLKIAESRSTHEVAAAFTLGREDVIPIMFQALIGKLNEQCPGELSLFQDYLDRHIKIDADRHGPMALQMLVQLCGDDPRKWKEAEDAARVALFARIALWDGVAEQITSAGSKGRLMNDGSPRSHKPPFSQDFAGARTTYWK
jgi:DUF3050 family protein